MQSTERTFRPQFAIIIPACDEEECIGRVVDELAGTIDHRRGQVDPKRAARCGLARGLPGRLPGPAADVEDMVVELDAYRPAQHLVVPPQFGVVAAEAWRIFACGVPHRAPSRWPGSAGRCW